MDFKQISDLIKLVNRYKLAEFKLKENDFELVIRSDRFTKAKSEVRSQHVPIATPQVLPVTPSITPSPPVPEVKESPKKDEDDKDITPDNLIEVKSPMVGTFYRSSSPEKAPYVKIGDVIEVGSVVCIIEAMKLFNEIESEVSGKVVKILANDATPVEYDQTLFLIDPTG